MGSASGKLGGYIMGEGLELRQPVMGATDGRVGQSISQLSSPVFNISDNDDDNLELGSYNYLGNTLTQLMIHSLIFFVSQQIFCEHLVYSRDLSGEWGIITAFTEVMV